MNDPVLLIEIAVRPASGDSHRLDTALELLTRDDPAVRARVDHESAQTILCGQDEPRLQAFLDRLRAEVPLTAGLPQVAYRESLAKPVELVYTHKKQSGGSGQFGEVKVALEPGERGTGIIFTDEIKGGNIPREYIPSVEKGMRETAAGGSLIGFPIIDFNIRLLDGKYHDMDSSALAFEITGRGAMREGARKAGIKLLEPIMKVEVVTDAGRVAVIRSRLARRGAWGFETVESDPGLILTATARLAAMLGFDSELDTLGRGEARLAMNFDSYALIESDPDSDPDVPAAAALRA